MYVCLFGFFLFPIQLHTVKPALRDHCHERPPVLSNHLSLVDGPTFQYNWTCHQKPPVLRDHIFMVNGLVFQDRFYCTLLTYTGLYRYYTLAPGPWNASSKSPRICWASSPFISVTLTRGNRHFYQSFLLHSSGEESNNTAILYFLYYMKSASGRLLLAQVS